jgi:hypothetical protein
MTLSPSTTPVCTKVLALAAGGVTNAKVMATDNAAIEPAMTRSG